MTIPDYLGMVYDTGKEKMYLSVVTPIRRVIDVFIVIYDYSWSHAYFYSKIRLRRINISAKYKYSSSHRWSPLN